MDNEERTLLVDMIAQAVIDRIDERDRMNRLTDAIVARVLRLQAEERELHQPHRLFEGAAPDGANTLNGQSHGSLR